jgi:hypothetical protein
LIIANERHDFAIAINGMLAKLYVFKWFWTNWIKN